MLYTSYYHVTHFGYYTEDNESYWCSNYQELISLLEELLLDEEVEEIKQNLPYMGKTLQLCGCRIQKHRRRRS